MNYSLGLNEDSFHYIINAFPNLEKLSIIDSSQGFSKYRELSYSIFKNLIEKLSKLKFLELNSYIC